MKTTEVKYLVRADESKESFNSRMKMSLEEYGVPHKPRSSIYIHPAVVDETNPDEVVAGAERYVNAVRDACGECPCWCNESDFCLVKITTCEEEIKPLLFPIREK